MSPKGDIRIANPDEERDENLFQEVPKVTVESQEYVPTMIDIDLSRLDRNFKYRLVNVAPLKVARARSRRYVVVDGNEEDVYNLVGERIQPDENGVIRIMDTILMKVPRASYQARRRMLSDKSKSRLGSQRRRFKRKAADLGRQRYNIPVETITDKEPQGSRD